MEKLLALSYWVSALVVVIGAGGAFIDFGIWYYVFAGWCGGASVVVGKDFWYD